MPADICVVLLAAGRSSRLGQNKLWIPLGGRSLLHRAVELAKSVQDEPSIVTGPDFPVAKLPQGCHWVTNPEPARGMGSSISAGVASLPESCAGLLLLTVDQYRLVEADLAMLVSAWQTDPSMVVVSEYGGSFGIPAIFPQRLFNRLKALDPDQGAKRLIAELSNKITIPLTNAAFDLDTPDDLVAAVNHFAQHPTPDQ